MSGFQLLVLAGCAAISPIPIRAILIGYRDGIKRRRIENRFTRKPPVLTGRLAFWDGVGTILAGSAATALLILTAWMLVTGRWPIASAP